MLQFIVLPATYYTKRLFYNMLYKKAYLYQIALHARRPFKFIAGAGKFSPWTPLPPWKISPLKIPLRMILLPQ
jgi:hypothetical protein